MKYKWIWYILEILLLLSVFVLGSSSHGAKRWIRFGSGSSLQLQPSEFLKIVIIVFLPKLIATYKERLNTFRFLFVLAILMLFPVGLVVLEPDLSTTLLICMVILTIIFCAGLSYKIIGIAILIVVPVVSAFLIYVISVPNPIIIEKYQRDRIVNFINGNKEEEEDAANKSDGNYQQEFAVQAIGSGQLTGKGLNNNDPSSLKNANYIFEAQNDFIFAVIGEELGFVGCLITIGLLFLIVSECIISAIRAKNFEGRLLCCGAAAYIAFQSFINIGVVTWILPNTGIPLPFFSCGITSLITVFTVMGMVLNVSLQRTVDRDDDMFADDFRG